MPHTNTWSNTAPTDLNMLGEGAAEIRKTKLDIKERIEQDHNMDGILDTTLPTADGYHKKVTLKVQASDPAILTGGTVLYAKADGVYFRNSVGIVKIV